MQSGFCAEEGFSTLLDGGSAFSSFARLARGGREPEFGTRGDAPREPPKAVWGALKLLRAAGTCGEPGPNGELDRAETGERSRRGKGWAGESMCA